MLIRNYYLLTKPGIIYGNGITALGGFFLASAGNINLISLFGMICGLSLVIASACVFNNLMDKNIDAKMERTKNRAMVKGLVSKESAVIFGTTLFLLGTFTLGLLTNLLTLLLAVFGFLAYVIFYGISKRRTVHGTVIGSLSGAIPPVVGYCAVTNQFDLGALLLFVILCFWQMPHFYAIALYRLDDYARAKIPVLPLVGGVDRTKKQILIYILGFIISSSLLSFYKFTGFTYLVVILVLGVVWLWLGIRGFKNKDDKVWARKMFKFSLVIIICFCLMISIDSVIGNTL